MHTNLNVRIGPEFRELGECPHQEGALPDVVAVLKKLPCAVRKLLRHSSQPSNLCILFRTLDQGASSWPNTSVPLMRNRVIIGESSESRPRQAVRRASDGCRTVLEDVRVDHRRADVAVPEKLL